MQTIKIKLNNKDTSKKVDSKMLLSNKPQEEKKHPIRKGFMILSVPLAIIFTYISFTAILPYLSIKSEISDIQNSFSSIKTDIDNKDLTSLDHKISENRNRIKNIERNVNILSQYRFIPIANGYLNNADKSIKIANHAFDIIDEVIPSVKNTFNSMGYKTSLNTEGQNLNDEERLDAFVQKIPELANAYDKSEPKILGLIDEVSKLDPEYLPKSEKYDLKAIISSLQQGKDDYSLFSEKIKDTLKVLPTLLGSDGQSKYLILFNNENEMRASGGLISAYGFMDVNKGKISDQIETNDSWYIHAFLQKYLGETGASVGLTNPDGQAYWMVRGCGGDPMRVQDSGVYPDNIINLETFKKYYQKASDLEDLYEKGKPKDFPKYDGVIVISTKFASDLLSIVEPLEMPAYKETLTSANLAERMSYQTELANPKYDIGSKERKTFVKDVATALKDKITKSDLTIMPKVLKAVITGFQEKHIFMYSEDKDLQEFFGKWGVTGEMDRTFDGDYLNISEAQVCGKKSNLWVRDTVTQTIEIKDDGKITRDVKIDWINEAIPQKGQENIFDFDYPYRAWIRLFVPKDTKLLSSKNGVYYKSENYYDKHVERNAIENLFEMNWRRSTQAPPAKYTLENKYEITKKYDEVNGYRLLIQKHPGKAHEIYNTTVIYKGNEYKIEFALNRDKVVVFKDGNLTVENFDQRLDGLLVE